MREQARSAGEDRDRLHRVGGETEIEHDCGHGHRDVHGQALPPRFGDGVAEGPCEHHVRPTHAALVGQFEDALGPWVDRAVNRVPEARNLCALVLDGRRQLPRDCGWLAPCFDLPLRLDQKASTFLRGSQNHRARAENPRRDCTLQRARVGGERHPGGDVGRHHSVLGDRNEQEVEEVALFLGRLSAGDEQVKILREGQAAHQVAREVPTAHLDSVGVGLAHVRDGLPGLADLHAASCPHGAVGRQQASGSHRSLRKCEAPPERGFV
jgi:hypothetical protein